MINVFQCTDKNILGMLFLLYHPMTLRRQAAVQREQLSTLFIIKKKQNQNHGKHDTLFVAPGECDSPPAF